MADSTTKFPVKTEGRALTTAPAGGWAPFEALRREIDRAFEGFGIAPWRHSFGRSAMDFDLAWPREVAWSATPAIDVAEKEREFEITAELPGLDQKDVEVKLSNGSLTIKGEKRQEKEEKEKDYYLSERKYGSFMRSFRLPDGIDTGKIEATFDKGILTVKLPKTVEAQRGEKKIEVKAA